MPLQAGSAGPGREVSKMFRRLHKEGGFTLLETLIAMVILGVSITILVEAYLTVTNGIEYQRTYNFLTAWSGDKMTELVNGMELARHGSFEHNGRELSGMLKRDMI